MKSNAMEVAKDALTCKKLSFPGEPWISYNPGFYSGNPNLKNNFKNAWVISRGQIQSRVISRISGVYTYTLVRSMHAQRNRLNNIRCSPTAGQETADAKAIVLPWRPRSLFCAKPQIWDKSERGWPALHASHNLLQNVYRDSEQQGGLNLNLILTFQ